MEKRFRERSDRSGGGPVATEEIDIRIADEARQFFDDSAKTLEAVVPQLQEGEQGREMLETTGEIRKKIDEFFTDASEPQGVQAAQGAPSGQSGTPRRAASAGGPPTPPMSTGVPAAAQMDLKTALEKLRRHGAAKASGQVARPPSPPPGRLPVLDSSASLEARPFAAPTRAGSSETPASLSETLPSMDAAAQQPARQRESADLLRHLSSLPPIDTDEIGQPVQAPPTLRGHRAPETREFTEDGEPKEPVAAAPAALADREREAVPERAPAAERLRTPAPDLAGGEFDSIFSAVEGIVLDTLKSSMNETMSAARKSEPELAHVAVPTAEPMMEVPDAPDTVTQDLSQDLSDRVQAGESEDVSEGFAQESDGFAHEVAPKLPAPRDDDEDEDLDSDLPAAGPYDWGVKPVARPKGAWLLDTPEGGAEAPAPAKSAAEPAPAPEAPPSGGPRAFLIRKASDEVRKFQPVMDALHKSNLIDPDQIAPSSGGPSLADEDEDSVSLDSFRDDRPSPEELEAELSPMRLVEELRRLRRVTQALVDKGLISGDDLENSQSD